IAAEFFDHPTRKLKLAAVTGTDGKTTTVHLVSDVLEASGAKTGFATTVDFKVADHEWKNDTRQSTQEAVEVQEFFAELLVAGGTWGVLEATSHALALRKLRGTEVDIAVFTNLSPEHLDFHGSLQKYLEAEGEICAMLATSTAKGMRKPAELHGRDGLPRARAVRGRMEPVESGQPFSVIVDYAHTPESLDKVLGLLRPLTKGKLIAVFGSAGERDRAKRPALAEVAAKYADLFVITQEDPRLEDPAKILEEIEKGAIDAGKQRGTDYLVIDDRHEAVSHAIRRAGPEDTVLLAGKGHEESIIVGEAKRPYDEATAARDALKALGFGA